VPVFRPSAGPVGLGADHGGFRLKDALGAWLHEGGWTVADQGTDGPGSVDYPDFAAAVAEGVAAGRFAFGLLVCGTGLGMSIKANRYSGVRAAVCTSAYMARMARAHNDANVLCLGERVIGGGQAEDILRAFVETDFEGGRHERRIAKFDP
jgi:ribose 5-phosphate isomerase B